MKLILFLIVTILNNSLHAKEWKSLKTYQKVTHKQELSASDWLKSDRIKNTIVWQRANMYNLQNSLSQEYIKIVERRDFYKWFYSEIQTRGHDVVWVTMAHFISKKIHLMEVFPYVIFSNKKIKDYANQGSETVFNNAFSELKKLFYSSNKMVADKALAWDRLILKEEQYHWVENIYKTIDTKSLKRLERIAKGQFLYGLLMPKQVKFKGDLFNAEMRYNYALEVLRPYCKKAYK